jgi:hypothetical protein
MYVASEDIPKNAQQLKKTKYFFYLGTFGHLQRRLLVANTRGF